MKIVRKMVKKGCKEKQQRKISKTGKTSQMAKIVIMPMTITFTVMTMKIINNLTLIMTMINIMPMTMADEYDDIDNDNNDHNDIANNDDNYNKDDEEEFETW